MKNIISPVPFEHLSTLTEYFEKKVFYSEANLFYEEHVPHVAYLLLGGRITLGKKNKVVKFVEGTNLIGIKNLYQRIPVKFFASITPNSTVLIIDRTTLFKVINKRTHLYNFLFN
jgi:signal-transduction protein with cAMP-binding, CBS, and nucleotidyltransferase domain